MVAPTKFDLVEYKQQCLDFGQRGELFCLAVGDCVRAKTIIEPANLCVAMLRTAYSLGRTAVRHLPTDRPATAWVIGHDAFLRLQRRRWVTGF